jgi:hypothetical protein
MRTACRGDGQTRAYWKSGSQREQAIMLRIDSRLLYLDHVVGRDVDLFAAVCARDLEGVVAKWKHGRYYTSGDVSPG